MLCLTTGWFRIFQSNCFSEVHCATQAIQEQAAYYPLLETCDGDHEVTIRLLYSASAVSNTSGMTIWKRPGEGGVGGGPAEERRRATTTGPESSLAQASSCTYRPGCPATGPPHLAMRTSRRRAPTGPAAGSQGLDKPAPGVADIKHGSGRTRCGASSSRRRRRRRCRRRSGILPPALL